MTHPTEVLANGPRDTAVVFDLSNWSLLQISGRDAYSFLHNFCTSEIRKLPRGRVCEAFVTNVKARVLGHVFVMSWPEIEGGEATQEPDKPRLRVFGSPGQGEKLATHLDRYLIREEVTIEEMSSTLSPTFVSGKDAAALVDAAARNQEGEFRGGPQLPADLLPGETIAAVFDSSPTMISRLDLFGQPGVLILHDRQDGKLISDRLITAGGVFGEAELLESLRVEACFPYYGTDITEDHLAPEVGRPWAISYTKGCYLGQEPIARIDALGHVNKLLRGVKLDAGPVPVSGAAIIADDKEIGTVTSSTKSARDGQPIALAYLRSKFSEAGTRVHVVTSEGEVMATVFGSLGQHIETQ